MKHARHVDTWPAASGPLGVMSVQPLFLPGRLNPAIISRSYILRTQPPEILLKYLGNLVGDGKRVEQQHKRRCDLHFLLQTTELWILDWFFLILFSYLFIYLRIFFLKRRIWLWGRQNDRSPWQRLKPTTWPNTHKAQIDREYFSLIASAFMTQK